MMRGAYGDDPGNYRGSVRADHVAGSKAHLYGYSLEVVNKYGPPYANEQIQASGGDPVLMPGQLRLAEELRPFKFPKYLVRGAANAGNLGNPGNPRLPNPSQGTSGSDPEKPLRLVNFGRPGPSSLQGYIQSPGFLVPPKQPVPGGGQGGGTGGPIPGGGQGQPGGQDILAPVFRYPFKVYSDIPPTTIQCANLPPNLPGTVPVEVYSASFHWGGQSFDAWDFFQSRGVLLCRRWDEDTGTWIRIRPAVRYTKQGVPVDQNHWASQAFAYLLVTRNRRIGIIEAAAFQPGDTVLGAWILCEAQTRGLRPQSGYPQGGVPGSVFNHANNMVLISILTTGSVESQYLPWGVVQIRGYPPPWEAGRPNLSGADVFRYHPDDTIEWIRFRSRQGGMLVGYHGGGEHRDYPRGRGNPSLANQMFHPQGSVVGQVVELGAGGAGYGDYVTITTRDANVHDVEGHRVYRVVEREDGRFFVGLFRAGQPSTFVRAYSEAERTRLSKFPTGVPPEIGNGRFVFFGDAVRGAYGGGGGISSTRFFEPEEEIDTGFVLDEVRVTVNPDRFPNGEVLTQHVLVPLENGRVKRIPTGDGSGGEFIGGAISKGRAISRSNPMEIFVVAVGKVAGGAPQLFGERSQAKQGVLQIGSELFFFENPRAGQSMQGRGHLVSPGIKGVQVSQPQGRGQPTPQAQVGSQLLSGQRHPGDRARKYTIAASATGFYEPEGFAMIRFGFRSLRGFQDIFYYADRSGGFSGCLRGQFQTSVSTLFEGNHNFNQDEIFNITTRLRLIGRGLLGSPRETHGFGDPVSFVPFLDMAEISGPLTDVGLPIQNGERFPPAGYALLDSTMPGRPFEIIAYNGRQGDDLLLRPRDERGKGILRARFGTVPGGIGQGMFAYSMPFRHYDRCQFEVDSEDLAYFQKTFREPGAVWRRVVWKERERRDGKDLLCDVVLLVRFDGAPDWSAK
ncbi:MAG: hypothetical protein O7J95_05105, partial [Planctomycetota bacterium]|nr:hypothetical protein [Planctomycetota bacterium]